MMLNNKILIIDDKPVSEDFSTINLLKTLNSDERILIDYFEDSNLLWKESKDGDDIELLMDFGKYSVIFIHDSYENPLVNEGLKAILIEKLSITSLVVLFSGSRDESEVPIKKVYDKQISKEALCYELLRRQYYKNFKNFINGFLLTEEYQIKYLYNSYINPLKDKAYVLLEMVRIDLEESVKFATESEEFKKLLILYDYKDLDEIIERFSQMDDDEFIEKLEDLIETN